MPETVASANARMACLDCGESNAIPVVTEFGKYSRLCASCIHSVRWDAIRFVGRDLLDCELRDARKRGS